MTRIAATIVLALTAFVMTADPYTCADGCADGPVSSSSSASGCVICQRGLALGTTATEGAVAAVRPREIPFDSAILVPALCRSIDHPPRIA